MSSESLKKKKKMLMNQKENTMMLNILFYLCTLFPQWCGETVKQANNFRNLFLFKAAMLRREFKLGIQSLISVSRLNIK